MAVELKAERLAHALALVVARPDASAADVAPVRLGLRMHVRVAVDLSNCEWQRMGLRREEAAVDR